MILSISPYRLNVLLSEFKRSEVKVKIESGEFAYSVGKILLIISDLRLSKELDKKLFAVGLLVGDWIETGDCKFNLNPIV